MRCIAFSFRLVHYGVALRAYQSLSGNGRQAHGRELHGAPEDDIGLPASFEGPLGQGIARTHRELQFNHSSLIEMFRN